MRIAVIGWGSLIWCPGSLQIRRSWRTGGPRLPVEFSRISRDGRLTLVIHPGVPDQPTFWALSSETELDAAIENLRIREGTKKEYIHFNKKGVKGESVQDIVRQWLEGHDDLDAAIWTGLPSNWKEKRRREFTVDDAAQYLEELVGAVRAAEEYIRNAPEVIRTEVRDLVERELDWTPNPLPPLLFEEPE